MAINAGADALGLVAAMPSGPGPIPETLIGEIADSTPPGVSRFLLTPLTDPDQIADQHSRCRTDTIQLCDELPTAAFAALRERLPSVRLVQVIHVANEASIEQALAVQEHVDALLLDSGRPDAAVKELGGTGRVHDWKLSRKICRRASKPVYLAGGLNAKNVAEAIAAVEPFGVDLCSGVRTNGDLDPEILRGFMSAIRSGA